MASDHLGPETRRSPSTPILFGALAPTPDLGLGFGLGFAVRTHSGRNPLPGSIGDFFWSGVSGTYFWIDPKQQLIAILMMQAPMQRLHYRYLMRTMVYQAIVG
jgi:Beta-lactamase class C and other penicillin binding proteins